MGLVSKNIVIRNAQVRPKFVEFISSQTASGAGSSITTSSLPPSTANGDFMLAVYTSQSYSGASNWYTPPAGWTEILDYYQPISGISYKTAVVPGDAGFTWSGSGGSTTRFLQLSFRQNPNLPLNLPLSVDVIGTQSNIAANNGTITIPSITTTVDNSVVLAIIISGEALNRPATPTGYTLRAERFSAGEASIFVYTRDQAVAGATGVVTTNFPDAVGAHYGILISLRPNIISYTAGLFKTTYAGYFNDVPSFFATAIPTTYGANPATSVQTTEISEPISADGNTFSIQWLGYFLASTTEIYTFFTASDDASYVWVGVNAITGFTTGNATVNNGGSHGVQEQSGGGLLTAGVYYPIRIQFGDNASADELTFSYSTPTITKTTNVTGRVFYNPTTNGF